MKRIEWIINSLKLDTLKYVNRIIDCELWFSNRSLGWEGTVGKRRLQGWGCKTAKGGFRMLSSRTVKELKENGVRFPAKSK